MWWSWNLPPSEPSEHPPFLSIVITVRNEEAHLASLFENLLRQPGPFEIVLVDAESTDATWEIAERYRAAHPDRVRTFRHRGHRGAGRNFGVQQAQGELIAFTDGDCLPDARWAERMREGLAAWEVVAGRTRAVGSSRFGELERVELYQGGMDVTYPSCNLGYRRPLFVRLGGFDDRFITAEDIDLNLRAVRAGARIHYDPEMLVLHQTRATLARFLLQAFWNGYGRKQLTEKHGQLWAQYRYRRMLSSQSSPLAYARLAAALAGYFTRHLTALRPPRRIPTEGRESNANGKAQRA
jgi:glycosyltransferase involved in cell wall biosynthesis